MSEAQAPIIIDTIEARPREIEGEDPRIVRWAFNPVQRYKILSAQECGIAHVPFARFFEIVTFYSPREFHSTDETQAREIEKEITAHAAQSYIEESLAGKGAQINTNWGLQVGFFGERDAGKMGVISRTLTPTLSSIRAICQEFELPLPISQVCEGTDDLDYGARDTCVSCWQKWFHSDALQSYMKLVSAEGMAISERDKHTGAVVERIVRPTAQDFNAALTVAKRAFQVGIKTLQGQWNEIAKEYEEKLRKDISEIEHSYRKDLHQNKPQDREIAVVKGIAEAMNQGNQSSNAGQNNILEMLAASQQKIAESQAQTNQLLAILAQNQIAAPAPTPETPKPAKTAKDKGE